MGLKQIFVIRGKAIKGPTWCYSSSLSLRDACGACRRIDHFTSMILVGRQAEPLQPATTGGRSIPSGITGRKMVDLPGLYRMAVGHGRSRFARSNC